MNKLCIVFSIACVFLLEHTGSLFADNVMMCTFFDNPTAAIFKITDDGDIIFDYPVHVGGFPERIEFARNGKWGLVGGHTPASIPHTQITTVLSVDENRKVSFLGSVPNEHSSPVAISPDSKYGVYGASLQTLEFSKGTYRVIPTSNPISGGNIAFTCLTGHLLQETYLFDINHYIIKEYEILSDGRPGEIGYELDIHPSTGSKGIWVSPDGWTAVVLSLSNYSITVLRMREPSGYSIAQQFDSQSLNPYEADFTPDSKYAVISFVDPSINANIRTYSIGMDSKLTLVDALDLSGIPGEDMAVTLDGKYIITRALIDSKSYFYVVRLNEDGTMTYLPEKDYIFTGGAVSAMAFVPQSKTEVGNSWLLYE
jgi:hypothetical protein